MNPRMQKTISTLVLLGLAATGAHAQMSATAQVSATAIDDNKVLANGASTGPFTLTIEGTNTGANSAGVPYSSFGVVDFNFAKPAAPVSSISGNTLTFSAGDQASGYEANGVLDFYFASNTTASIDNPGSTLAYQTASSGPGMDPQGVGTQLGTLYSLGSQAYTAQTTRGTLDTFTLTPTGAAAQYFLSQYNAGQNVRLVISADSAANNQNMAANFYGYNSTSTSAKPVTLNFTPGAPAAAPEPSGIVAMLIGMGALGLIAARRRTQAA